MKDIMRRHLRAGRLSRRFISPYLEEDEGLDAVYKYAEVYKVPISNDTAYNINDLCGYDPFFISCVIQSDCPEKDLTKPKGVTATVDYEVQTPTSELADTWYEYIQDTVKRINERSGKQILLHLSKYNDRTWTPKQLKEALHLEDDENSIHEKLIALAKGDLIQDHSVSIRFQGLKDGTLSLILHHHFAEEIKDYQPDLRADFEKKLAQSEAKRRSIQNKYNDLVGKTAEHYLATQMKTRKRFKLSAFFNDVPTGDPYDKRLNMHDVRTRVYIQREDGSRMAPLKLLSTTCTPCSMAPVKFAPDNVVLFMVTQTSCTPMRSAPLSETPVRFAPVRFAPRKSAPSKLAAAAGFSGSPSFAPDKLVPTRLAPRRFAPVNSAPERCTPHSRAPIKEHGLNKTQNLSFLLLSSQGQE
ncbi:MAG: hypothetical protein AAF639_17955 [Chloroflexota bacterium]